MESAEFFSGVYRVSTRVPVPDDADFACLAGLPCSEPVGYCEYLKAFGEASFGSVIRVLSPAKVQKYRQDPPDWLPLVRERMGRDWWRFDGIKLTNDQTTRATVFAEQEGGTLFVCFPGLGRTLFRLPGGGGEALAMPDGIVGACRECSSRNNFSFLFVSPGAEHWGRRRQESVNVSATFAANLGRLVYAFWPQALQDNDRYFVRELEGIVTLYPSHPRLTAKSSAESTEHFRAFFDAAKQGGFANLSTREVLQRFGGFAAGVGRFETQLHPDQVSVQYDVSCEVVAQDFLAALRKAT